jgi:hypothetical protein
MLDRSTFSVSPLPNLLDLANINLSSSQKELLLWHQRYGHASFKQIQHLFALPRDGSHQTLIPRHQRNQHMLHTSVRGLSVLQRKASPFAVVTIQFGFGIACRILQRDCRQLRFSLKVPYQTTSIFQRVRVCCPVYVFHPTLQDAKRLPSGKRSLGVVYSLVFLHTIARMSTWS